MELVSERFDPNFIAQMLLELANEQSLETLLQKLVELAMERPHMACVQVWLIEKGDLCATCPRRPECPDQSRCLHLAAAKAKSIVGPGKGFGRLDPETAREPLRVPPLGTVVVSGQQRAVPDLKKQPVSPLDPDWMREEGIRGYAINSITYKGEALGAIVTGTRESFREELRPWGTLIANQIGAAIANARAFEELRVTGKRLEQANQKLERELAERIEAEAALRRSETYLAEGQRLSHTGSWAWSPVTLQASYWSEEMFRIFGFSPQEGLPTAEAFWQRIHPEDLGRARELLMSAAHRSMEYEHEHRIVLSDGTVKHIHALGHPVRDEAGKLVEYVGTAVDVTERKLAEDELRKHREHLEELVKERTEQLAEAKARAEAANREKSRFLANMSHELRTPLNAVLGFSRLLKKGPDVTPRQQEALDIIVRSGEHLLNLINNVLDMAKIESGSVVLEESEVDLHQLLHEIQSLMGVGAAEKGLRFTLQRAPDLPRFVAVDAGKLRQVLLNLVGNAIKYTDSGGVELRARPIRTADCRVRNAECGERAQVRFEVQDSGPGIGQEDCQRIFSPFVQLGGQAAAQAGTGLGLAICKQYVELMRGLIGVASEPGKGSVFYFSIQVSVLPSVAEPDEPKHGRILGLTEGQPRYRLLIVEDQAENRLLLRRLLDPLGFELNEAVNGQEAVSLFEQWRPDLIWMDIRMPVMDGLEAVRRIRAAKAGADTKIIALTAHALEQERSAIMAAGCDEFVSKPFREQEIFDALARHLRLKFIYEKASHPESAPELALHAEQLAVLPAELLRELREAVIELDTARTHALIEQVAERDPLQGRALKTLATQLNYEGLLKLLETVHSQTDQTL
jgi:PAS domain S-box-containing protein